MMAPGQPEQQTVACWQVVPVGQLPASLEVQGWRQVSEAASVDGIGFAQTIGSGHVGLPAQPQANNKSRANLFT